MKKLAVNLLLFFYLIPAIGIPVTFHYCSGQLASVSVSLTDKDLCACGSKKMKKTCCTNKTIAFNTAGHFSLLSQCLVNFQNYFQLNSITSPFRVFVLPTSFVTFLNNKGASPPGKETQTLFILHHVFRI